MREEKNEMLTWYLGVLAPIENLWVGREGMPVDDGGGEEKEGVHVMGHVDLIITLSNFSLSVLLGPTPSMYVQPTNQEFIPAKCKNVDRLWTFLCELMFGPNIRFWVDFASSRLENTSFGLEPSGTLTVGPLLRRR